MTVGQDSSSLQLGIGWWHSGMHNVILHFVDYRTQWMDTSVAQHCTTCRKQPV